jgi:tetratricopeptide (TPR) repeat protein
VPNTPPSTDERPRRKLWLVAGATVATLAAAAVTLTLTVFSSDSSATPSAAQRASTALNAGLAAQAKGDVDAAQASYRKALHYQPKNKYAIYDLAVIDYAHSKVAAAETGYRTVLTIDPAYEPALYNLAIIDQLHGRHQEALTLYQRAVQADPSDAKAHYNLALILRAMPKYKADGDAQMAIALRLDHTLHDPAA